MMPCILLGLLLSFLISAESAAHPALPLGITKQQLYGSTIRASGVCWKNPSGSDAHLTELVSLSAKKAREDNPVFLALQSAAYSKRFAADPGYQIDARTWHAEMADNESDLSCNVAENHLTAEFRVRLTSAPQYDRRRGWWGGSITLSQSRRN